ncbi:hypothetical protein GQ55_1G043000 [Panicum hallii var. hallii]|uniref:Uncharacterized protein n=1 Tax=Panicum hallii var. hallii TaxID=1504633 RepID=A0A2T7F248_9POAL|nr:hypothetical protein GQ55_1G043000 [Panicum hallii var. hallii]
MFFLISIRFDSAQLRRRRPRGAGTAAPSRHFPVAAWCRTPGFTAAFAPGRHLALASPPLAARRTAGRARTRSRCFWGGVTAGSKDQATHILHLMLDRNRRRGPAAGGQNKIDEREKGKTRDGLFWI